MNYVYLVECICIYTFKYACTYACTHVRMYACTHVHMHACTRARMYAIYMQSRMPIHTSTHTRTRTDIAMQPQPERHKYGVGRRNKTYEHFVAAHFTDVIYIPVLSRCADFPTLSPLSWRVFFPFTASDGQCKLHLDRAGI